MTRIAIVASSEKLRTSLAAALRTNPEFEVVGVAASSAEVPPSADVVLIARASAGSTVAARRAGSNIIDGTILSNREREILALLADGLVNKQIAARLGISTNTVKTHLELLFDKLGVATRAEAVATGVRRGLLLL
ncbi:MAG TPA: LuxR C-terminal-related transcriptional regulator [Gemmatimonadaceae bacterium]|jgi:DNA-binding NarL/FixJ family response regulator|nr:LuxR C-terminal-related transcriptional regulator [Gemmatimonadaceae bacterium]